MVQSFKCTYVDSNIYIRPKNTTSIIIAIYVNNCIVVSQHLHLIHELKHTLEKRFNMSYEGNINFFLGIQVIRNRVEGWMMLIQEKYMRGILHIFDMDNCHVITTPMEVGYMMSPHDPPQQDGINQFHDFVPYPHVVECLMHVIVHTKSNFAFSVYNLAQHLFYVDSTHWKYVKRVLRHIKNICCFGIKILQESQWLYLKGLLRCGSSW